LLNAIVKKTELFSAKVVNEISGAISYRDRQGHKV
jgi:hypothetical protein